MSKILKFASMFSIMLFAIIFCSGCATIATGYTQELDKTKSEYFAFELDEQQLTALNIDINATMTKLDEIIDKWWADTSLTKNLTGISYSKKKGATEYSRNVVITYDTKATFYNFFSNMQSYTPTEEYGIFSSKRIIYNGTTQFAQTATFDIYSQLETYLADTYFDGNTTTVQSYFDKIQIQISRIYPASYLIHSNADFIQKNSNYSVHIWETDLKTATSIENDKQMYIYQSFYTADNKRNWYLLGIGLTLVFGIILSVVLITKHKQKTPIVNRNNFNISVNTTPPDTLSQSTIKEDNTQEEQS